MRAELEQSFPGDAKELHGIVARQRYAEREYSAALHHALRARDYVLATDVLVKGGTAILTQGAAETVSELSQEVALHYPLLATARGLVENERGRRWVAREYFAAAIAGNRAMSKRATPERTCAVVAESMISRINGNTRASVLSARKAIDLIDRVGSDAFGDQLGELLATCALSFFRAGETEDLTSVLERIPISHPRGGLIRAGIEALGAAAHGDWALVAEVEEGIAAAGWPEDALNGYAGALLHLAQMLREISDGDWRAARRHLRELGNEVRTSEFRVLLVAADSVVDTLSGTPARALRKLSRVRETEHASRRLSGDDARLLDISQALAMSAADDVGGALRVLATLPATDPLAGLLRAHAHLLQRDHCAAGRALSAPALVTSSVPRLKRAHALLAAWTALEGGNEAEARRVMERTVRATAVLGEDGGLMLLPDDVRNRLLALFERGSDTMRLAARRQLLRELPAPFEVHDNGPRLTARELVVLYELRHGLTNPQIAKRLNVSRNTLKTQLRSAYGKLGVTNRDDAPARASALGLLGTADDVSRQPV